MSDLVDEPLAEEPPASDGVLVHWMEPRPMTLGPAGVSATAAGAFALGAVVAVAVLSLLHYLGPDREPPRRRWR
ncbi:MAG: hypothetical protein Q8M88_11320 [Phenylobacterium sp.]|uniref:hypothetical protein n=1 Tax=Phenylobacterium sp. TaxID=1871053 RepID=UPI002735C933|nr:hypothetical protein [Phenylobacterium sp.]MDP3175010.1 hypothetical protein [Phenylobacterium sp.]